MDKIIDLFKDKKHTCSFELFPPKTDKGYQNLLVTLDQLAQLKPDFISCTYGAGGGNREKTFDIVQHIEQKHSIIAMAHLTCVLNTKEDIKNIVDGIKSRGIKNILALRGDPPRDQPDWEPGPDNFRYSSELCTFIRKEHGPYFGIGVAGFPEGHVLCPDREQDALYMKKKIESEADFIITQLFFDNKDYFDYVKRLKKNKINVPVIPGILPITDYPNLLRFCQICGTTVTKEVKKIFEPISEDKEATLKEGIRFAIRQCQELLNGGAPGLHFYCLNKLHPTDTILSAVRK